MWEFRVATQAAKPQGSGVCVGLWGSVVCITIANSQVQCYKLVPQFTELTWFQHIFQKRE